MKLAPTAMAAAAASVPVLEEELRLAQLNYEAAYSRFLRSRNGSKEFNAWRAHTTRWRNKCTTIVTRLNRARAEAEGRAWLRAL